MRSVLDADSHIMEPSDTWSSNLPYAHKHEALSIVDVREPDEAGVSVFKSFLCHKGRRLFPVCGSTPIGLPRLDSITSSIQRAEAEGAEVEVFGRLRDSLMSYADQTPRPGYQPASRLQWMDHTGIEQAFITPTWGAMWERYLFDNPTAIRLNMEAYNRWIADFCSLDRARLHPVGQISPVDTNWAELEIQNLAKRGIRICALRPVLTNGKPLGHDDNDRLWSAIEHHDMAVYFHVSGTGQGERDFFEDGWYLGEAKGQHNSATWSVAAHVPILLTLTNLIRSGTFERHPNLRIAVIEHGTTWVAPWIRQFDSVAHLLRARSRDLAKRMPNLPSAYLQRHVWFSPFETEPLSEVVTDLGESRLMFSTDFPHPECGSDPVGDLLLSNQALTPSAMERFLKMNALEYVRA